MAASPKMYRKGPISDVYPPTPPLPELSSSLVVVSISSWNAFPGGGRDKKHPPSAYAFNNIKYFHYNKDKVMAIKSVGTKKTTDDITNQNASERTRKVERLD